MALFNNLKKISNPVKNTGIMNLDSINEAKSKTHERDENRQKNFSEIYKEAVILLKQFTENPNAQDGIKQLKNVAEKLIESLKHVKNNPEPYLLLAYIFYMIGEKNLAIEYIKLHESFSEQISTEAEILKKLVSEISHSSNVKRSVTGPLRTPPSNSIVKSVQKTGPPSIKRINRI